MGVLLAVDTAEVTDAAVSVVRQAITAVIDSHVGGDCEVSVLITTDEVIHSLNKEWRSVDAPTDVLSFSMRDDEPSYFEPHGDDLPLVLGDVVISWPRAQQQAIEYGHSLEREIAFLAVHGTLHLLGYDHEEEHDAEEMRYFEEMVMSLIGLGREE